MYRLINLRPGIRIPDNLNMTKNYYDIIVIGAGSGGLSVGLTMNKFGFKVLMLAKSDKDIGGDCLNDGCVPSKAFIHVSRLLHNAKLATNFGLTVNGKPDIGKAIEYVYRKQELIRKHENAKWLEEQGVTVELGEAKFSGEKEVEINGKKYGAKNIVIATGSKPRKLNVPGVELVKYYDNESIFYVESLPDNILVVGGGPIGMEIAQALSRFNKKVTVVHQGENILEHDDKRVTSILLKQLQQEGIEFIFSAALQSFASAQEAVITLKDGTTKKLFFEAVFVGIGRELLFEPLQLQNAGIEARDNKIIVDDYLRTTNKNIFVCGDIAGNLAFSHAAELHARILVNNFFSPLKKKLNNDHFSWVTFTDPEMATFGINEKQLKERKIEYETLETDFSHDDRAVVDNYQFGKIILFISKKHLYKKERILGGTMVAPNAGELIQELILANTNGLSINSIFHKIYPYPVASRINQQLITRHKENVLTDRIKKWLQIAYKMVS